MKMTSITKRLVNMKDGTTQWADIYTDTNNNDFAKILLNEIEYYVPVISRDGDNSYNQNGGNWIEV